MELSSRRGNEDIMHTFQTAVPEVMRCSAHPHYAANTARLGLSGNLRDGHQSLLCKVCDWQTVFYLRRVSTCSCCKDDHIYCSVRNEVSISIAGSGITITYTVLSSLV